MQLIENENINALLFHMSNLFEAHQQACGDEDTAAYEVLHALGTYAGSIMAQANDFETLHHAKSIFTRALEAALISQHATRH